MRRYVIRRILQTVPMLVGISVITFAVVHYAPGDPVTRVLDPRLSAAELQARREALGLDHPFGIQYLRWLGGVLRGDLGESLADGRPVLARIMEHLPATLELGLAALVLSLAMGIPLGVLGAVRRNSAADYLAVALALVGICIPLYVVGMLLQLAFAVHLGWLPLLGRSPSTGEATLFVRLAHLLLPAVTLALGATAGIARYLRSAMLDVVRQDFVRTARAKGLPERVVIYRHALRNALPPLITTLGLSLPGLVTGTILIETVFAWPGMGRLAVQSVFSRDHPTILGLTMVFSVLTIFGNLIADVLYGVVDPRIRSD